MPTVELSRDIIEAAIAGLEIRKQTIEANLRELRQHAMGGPSAEPASRSDEKGGGMSAAGRARIAEAQRRRWAAIKKGASAAQKQKRTLSPEGRQRIIEATKKRWAAVRAAKAKETK